MTEQETIKKEEFRAEKRRQRKARIAEREKSEKIELGKNKKIESSGAGNGEVKKKRKKKKQNQSFAKHIAPICKEALPLGPEPIYDETVTPELGKRFALLGATEPELAACFDVSLSTIQKWKREHEKFRVAVRQGGDIADANVAGKLYCRAVGYDHPDTHISNFQGEITETVINKHYPPSEKAGIYWLNNRRRRKLGPWSSASPAIEAGKGDDKTKTVIVLPQKNEVA